MVGLRHASRASVKDKAKKILGLWNLILAVRLALALHEAQYSPVPQGNLLRSLVIDAFNNPAPRSTLSLFLGALYSCALCTQLVSLLLPNHLRTMNADLMLSLSAALAITFASALRTVVRAALGADVLSECVALADGEWMDERLGVWGPAVVGKLNLDDATACAPILIHIQFAR